MLSPRSTSDLAYEVAAPGERASLLDKARRTGRRVDAETLAAVALLCLSAGLAAGACHVCRKISCPRRRRRRIDPGVALPQHHFEIPIAEARVLEGPEADAIDPETVPNARRARPPGEIRYRLRLRRADAPRTEAPAPPPPDAEDARAPAPAPPPGAPPPGAPVDGEHRPIRRTYRITGLHQVVRQHDHIPPLQSPTEVRRFSEPSDSDGSVARPFGSDTSAHDEYASPRPPPSARRADLGGGDDDPGDPAAAAAAATPPPPSGAGA